MINQEQTDILKQAARGKLTGKCYEHPTLLQAITHNGFLTDINLEVDGVGVRNAARAILTEHLLAELEDLENEDET